MQTFLIVVAGMGVGFTLVVSLGFLWLRRTVRQVGAAVGAVLDAAGTPPFRVSLVPTPVPAWADANDVARALQSFTAAGYNHCGDFEIPELDGLCLRSFFHRALGSFGVLYDHPEAGLYADLMREHDDGTSTTVSCGPVSGLDRPEHAPAVWVGVDVTDLNSVGQMHERLEAESGGRDAMPSGPADFPQVFVEAYTQEMDWRIARGGLTPDEIRRTAAIGEQPEPDACAVEQLRGVWRGAIDRFIAGEVRKAWLADGDSSAGDREALRDEIVVVHEHGVADDHVEDLAWLEIEGRFSEDEIQAEERALEEARAELAPLFAEGVRIGFSKAQLLLPEKRRHQLLASFESPWRADVYRPPADPESR
jgi:hypothetical protein